MDPYMHLLVKRDTTKYQTQIKPLLLAAFPNVLNGYDK